MGLNCLRRPVILVRISSISARCLTSNPAKSATSIEFPDPPKRPPTPFLAFAVKKRLEIVEQKQDIKSNEVIKYITSAWKDLAPENKKAYEEKWAKQFHDFKVQHTKWWQHLSVEQQEAFGKAQEETKKKKGERRLKKQLRLLGKPRRALTAFNFYVSRNISELKNTNDVPRTELFRKLAVSWKGLSDKDKQPYVDLEIRDLDKYREEKVAWEAKMHDDGHNELIAKKSTPIDEKVTVKSAADPPTTSNKKNI